MSCNATSTSEKFPRFPCASRILSSAFDLGLLPVVSLLCSVLSFPPSWVLGQGFDSCCYAGSVLIHSTLARTGHWEDFSFDHLRVRALLTLSPTPVSAKPPCVAAVNGSPVRTLGVNGDLRLLWHDSLTQSAGHTGSGVQMCLWRRGPSNKG